jgi:hypothetical protein
MKWFSVCKWFGGTKIYDFLCLVRSHAFEGAGTAPVVKGTGEFCTLNDAVYAIAFNAATKDEDVAGIGSNNKVLLVDGALDAAGLVGTFEVSFNDIALLLEVEVFAGGGAVRVFAIEGPLASDAGGLLLGWRLLRKGGEWCEAKHENKNFALYEVHGNSCSGQRVKGIRLQPFVSMRHYLKEISMCYYITRVVLSFMVTMKIDLEAGRTFER